MNNSTQIKRIELPFVTLDIFKNYFIGTIKEGKLVTPEKSDIITTSVVDNFKEEPFVYISNRINSYAVDPSIYPDMSKIENMVGFAVVSENYIALNNAEFEKVFYKKPFETFNSIEKAIEWSQTIIENYRKETLQNA